MRIAKTITCYRSKLVSLLVDLPNIKIIVQTRRNMAIAPSSEELAMLENLKKRVKTESKQLVYSTGLII